MVWLFSWMVRETEAGSDDGEGRGSNDLGRVLKATGVIGGGCKSNVFGGESFVVGGVCGGVREGTSTGKAGSNTGSTLLILRTILEST